MQPFAQLSEYLKAVGIRMPTYESMNHHKIASFAF